MKNIPSIQSSRNIIPVLILLAIVSIISIFYESTPVYTRLAFIYLLLPSLFIFFKKGGMIDRKKFLIVLVVCFVGTIIWDTVSINLNIWGFPTESISFYFLGIPFEEYIFTIGFVTMAIGIYQSLPHFRTYLSKHIHFAEVPLIIAFSLLQFAAWAYIFFFNSASYITWLLIFAAIPSLVYVWRKGEKIDDVRLIITCLLMIIIVFIIDPIFISGNAWYYNDNALIGRIGIVPIDDILFAVFNTITVVGLYTSLPSKHALTVRW